MVAGDDLVGTSIYDDKLRVGWLNRFFVTYEDKYSASTENYNTAGSYKSLTKFEGWDGTSSFLVRRCAYTL
jgi:hypothetical protein